MQIQKEIEYAGEFSDFKEVEFEFKKLDEELSQQETYNGVDNFVKYFIKVSMSYQGGSLLAGSELEKLHEITVKNQYALRHAQKRFEELKQVSLHKTESADDSVALDQTFDAAVKLDYAETSAPE